MDMSFEVRLGRSRADFTEKLAAYGVRPADDSKEGPADGLSSYIWRGEPIDLSWRDAWEGDLPLTPAEFKSFRHWARHIYKLSGIKIGTPVMEKLIRRLRADHFREVHLPSRLYRLTNRAADARRTLTQLCAHPDSPSEAAVVLAHARMVEERVHERLWEIADLPSVGYKDADVTVLDQVLTELETQTAEAVRLCTLTGSVMLAGIDQDASLLDCLRRDSIMVGQTESLA